MKIELLIKLASQGNVAALKILAEKGLIPPVKNAA